MKKLVLSCCLFLFVFSVMVEQVYSDFNLVICLLVLQYEEVVVIVGVGYGELYNGESIIMLLLVFVYGVIDDVIIGLFGVCYWFNVFDSGNQFNLELLVEGGLMGFYEFEEFGDSFVVGLGFVGKYCFFFQFVFIFGVYYVLWIEDECDNCSEVCVNGGMLYQVYLKFILFVQVEYCELKDFVQDNVVNVLVGGIWNVLC